MLRSRCPTARGSSSNTSTAAPAMALVSNARTSASVSTIALSVLHFVLCFVETRLDIQGRLGGGVRKAGNSLLVLCEILTEILNPRCHARKTVHLDLLKGLDSPSNVGDHDKVFDAGYVEPR